MRESLAIELYRRYLGGETVEQLSVELGISAERIRKRLDAAEAHLERRGARAA